MLMTETYNRKKEQEREDLPSKYAKRGAMIGAGYSVASLMTATRGTVEHLRRNRILSAAAIVGISVDALLAAGLGYLIGKWKKAKINKNIEERRRIEREIKRKYAQKKKVNRNK